MNKKGKTKDLSTKANKADVTVSNVRLARVRELALANRKLTLVIVGVLIAGLLTGGTLYSLELRLDSAREDVLSGLKKDITTAKLSSEFELSLLKEAEKELDKAKSKEAVKNKGKKFTDKVNAEIERKKAEAEIDALLETSGLTDADVAMAKAEIKKAGGDIAAIKKTVAKTQSTAAAKPKPNKPSGSTSGGSSGSSGGAVSYTHDYHALRQIAINVALSKGGIYEEGLASWTGSTPVDSSVSPEFAKKRMTGLGGKVDGYRKASIHEGGDGTVYFNIRMVPSGNGYAYSFVYGYDRGN